jgi:hypothetical protein
MDFISILSKCTGIPADVIAGRTKPIECSVAERMSWASKRITTRDEDTAYCLLGIFNVNMPLLYGEGMKAFRRLQEEIIKINNDLTIFAWETPQPYDIHAFNLFAETPAAFINSFKIRPFGDECEDFSVTNKASSYQGKLPCDKYLSFYPTLAAKLFDTLFSLDIQQSMLEAPGWDIFAEIGTQALCPRSYITPGRVLRSQLRRDENFGRCE